MIVYRQWQQDNGKHGDLRKHWSCEGWFLLGFIPLYVRKYPL